MLVNFVVGGTFFMAAYRFAKANVNPMIITAIPAAWAIVGSFAAFATGKMLTRDNNTKLIATGCFGIVITSIG